MGQGPFSACRNPSAANTAEFDINGALVISVIHSGPGGMGGEEEDGWPVEIHAGATMADLKAKIEELYDIPQQVQRLVRVEGNSEPSDLEDHVPVSTLRQRRVHLLPASYDDFDGEGGEADMQGMTAGFENLLGAMQESMEVNAALEESLRGVTWKVHFYRPEDSGGAAAGRGVALVVDALALAQDVQQMAELELFGSVGAEPAYLSFEGRILPPQSPLFHAGIEDGKVVQVLSRPPPRSEDDPRFLVEGMVGNGAGGHMMPAYAGM